MYYALYKKWFELFLYAENIVTDEVHLHMLGKFLISVEDGPNDVVVH